MKGSTIKMVAGLCLAVLAGTAHAGDVALNPAAPPPGVDSVRAGDLQSYILAANEAPDTNATRNMASAVPARKVEFSEPWVSLNKTHEYLGVATILSAFATMATAPECETNCSNQTSGTHQSLGRTTRALALSAVVTGVAAHWDDIHLFEDGLKDPDTQHWLIAGTGALLLANAVSKAPARSHAGQAELGAALMLVGIKLVW
jgi:hypothetical protein